MNFIFDSLVEDDILDAYEWYESKQVGLGEEFLLALDKSSYLIQRNPMIFAIKYFDFHICLIDRFPYSIHFKVDEETIFVSGIYHTSRSPKKWIREI
jgi:toxin ParE1/3/4